MKPKRSRKLAFPPVIKLLARGYLIISFILLVEYFEIIRNVPFIIYLITVVSISMVFGVGYLLAVKNGPVRQCSYNIHNTALFFVKGIIVIYFVSLLAEFGFLPENITSAIMAVIAAVLILAGVFSYIYEVFERSRPVPGKAPAPRPRIQRAPSSRSSAVRGRSS